MKVNPKFEQDLLTKDELEWSADCVCYLIAKETDYAIDHMEITDEVGDGVLQVRWATDHCWLDWWTDTKYGKDSTCFSFKQVWAAYMAALRRFTRLTGIEVEIGFTVVQQGSAQEG